MVSIIQCMINDGIEVSLLFYVMLLKRNIADVEMLVKNYISYIFLISEMENIPFWKDNIV